VRPPIRVLLVDDYSPFRGLLRTALGQFPDLEVVGEASDGLDAVQKFGELRPELILSEIGLPTLTGIEITRWIRTYSGRAKILIVSQHRSWEIVEEALRSGASGYLVKSDIADELRLAVDTVLQGIQFLSTKARESCSE
jgi:DNA-binding NarL/FixJ family response regulator